MVRSPAQIPSAKSPGVTPSPSFAILEKAMTMPQTVPRRPMRGEMEAMRERIRSPRSCCRMSRDESRSVTLRQCSSPAGAWVAKVEPRAMSGFGDLGAGGFFSSLAIAFERWWRWVMKKTIRSMMITSEMMERMRRGHMKEPPLTKSSEIENSMGGGWEFARYFGEVKE